MQVSGSHRRVPHWPQGMRWPGEQLPCTGPSQGPHVQLSVQTCTPEAHPVQGRLCPGSQSPVFSHGPHVHAAVQVRVPQAPHGATSPGVHAAGPSTQGPSMHPGRHSAWPHVPQGTRLPSAHSPSPRQGPQALHAHPTVQVRNRA